MARAFSCSARFSALIATCTSALQRARASESKKSIQRAIAASCHSLNTNIFGYRSLLMNSLISSGVLVAGVVVLVLVAVPIIVAKFLRNVEAGEIRLVSWLGGGTIIYRGPGKSKEIPLLTTGTTISSKVINVDLDITDQTADIGENEQPQPIKVRVLASAIVSVGDTDPTIKTAANRFFSKPEADQMSALTDLLSSSGRRAINLLTHDQLFSARSAPGHAHDAALPVPVTTSRALQVDG